MGVYLRRKAISKNRESLYLDLYRSGVRRYEFLKIYLVGKKEHDKEALRLAEMIRSRRELELLANAYDLVTSQAQKTKLVDYSQRVALEHGEKTMWTRAHRYLEAFAGATPLNEVSTSWVTDYKNYLLKSGLNKNSASQYFDRFRALMTRAASEGLITRNPCDVQKGIPYQEPEKHALTPEHLKKLSETRIMGAEGTGGIMKRAFFFACNTGLRISDIRDLNWGHIENGRLEKIQVKTKKRIVIPLNRMALECIGPRPANVSDETKVFDLKKTDPNQYIGNWAKEAGIPFKMDFHTSRHTFSSLLLVGGANPFTIKALMGHKNLDMTTVYTHANLGLLETAVGNIHV